SFTLLIPRPPTPPLFPYTTLFRSPPSSSLDLEGAELSAHCATRGGDACVAADRGSASAHRVDARPAVSLCAAHLRRIAGSPINRSEEHTSELQSQSNLVCRLLLEK